MVWWPFNKAKDIVISKLHLYNKSVGENMFWRHCDICMTSMFSCRQHPNVRHCTTAGSALLFHITHVSSCSWSNINCMWSWKAKDDTNYGHSEQYRIRAEDSVLRIELLSRRPVGHFRLTGVYFVAPPRHTWLWMYDNYFKLKIFVKYSMIHQNALKMTSMTT